MDTVVNDNYVAMADVVAMHYVGRSCTLKFVADVMATFTFLCGRWKATVADVIAMYVEQVADVANMADGMAI